MLRCPWRLVHRCVYLRVLPAALFVDLAFVNGLEVETGASLAYSANAWACRPCKRIARPDEIGIASVVPSPLFM